MIQSNDQRIILFCSSKTLSQDPPLIMAIVLTLLDLI